MYEEFHLKRSFKYHWRTESINLTHLVFADDLLLVCKVDCESLSLLMDGIQMFSNITGLKLNTDKCNCFFANVSAQFKDFALNLTGFSEGTFPFFYLGIPLISGPLLSRHCAPLLTKLCRKIDLWT